MSLDVLLADDHVLFRQALKVLLEREGFSVRAEACDGHEAVRLAATLRPDIAVLDIAMRALNGLDAARQITKVSSSTKSIALTMYTDDHYVIGALKASMRGYVIKTQAAQDLVAAIRSVNKGQIYLSPGVSGALIDAYLRRTSPVADPLTRRQRQVVQPDLGRKQPREEAPDGSLLVRSRAGERALILPGVKPGA